MNCINELILVDGHILFLEQAFQTGWKAEKA